MASRQEIIHRLNALEKYFLKHYSAGQRLFLPEYNASVEIGKIILKGDKLTLPDIEEIITIHNAINDADHYDGSGWADYQIQLLSLIKQDGISVELDGYDTMKINVG